MEFLRPEQNIRMILYKSFTLLWTGCCWKYKSRDIFFDFLKIWHLTQLSVISSIWKHNIGTKCNSLTQQFTGISTTIDTWATCFDSYRVIFRPSKGTDPISKVVKCTVGSPVLWGSHSALDYLANWICILWGPEDDSIRVEICSPCIYGCRYRYRYPQRFGDPTFHLTTLLIGFVFFEGLNMTR